MRDSGSSADAVETSARCSIRISRSCADIPAHPRDLCGPIEQLSKFAQVIRNSPEPREEAMRRREFRGAESV
jgi:hypothetical protein